MRPGRCIASNFGSYRHLEIDFSNLGLTLVAGPTGAGKSTLADLIIWCLWGCTSKDGSADDVLPWGLKASTQVTLEVHTPTGMITVTRTRSRQSGANDVYYTEASLGDHEIRGKDMVDTQRLISERIGADSDLAILAAIFSQFSDHDRFFTCRPKDRREVLEKITDLSLAVNVAARSLEARRIAKKELDALDAKHATESGRSQQITAHLQSLEYASVAWAKDRESRIAALELKISSFESAKKDAVKNLREEFDKLAEQLLDPSEFEKKTVAIRQKLTGLSDFRAIYRRLVAEEGDLRAQLNAHKSLIQKFDSIPDFCPTCERAGARSSTTGRLDVEKSSAAKLEREIADVRQSLEAVEQGLRTEHELQAALADTERLNAANERLMDQLDALERRIATQQEAQNPFLYELERLRCSDDPYRKQIATVQKERQIVASSIETIQAEKMRVEHRVESLTAIYDLSFSLRGKLLQSAVARLEEDTNNRLSQIFDSPFIVKMELAGSDRLDVQIQVGDLSVPFTSLSGGQRRMLVICLTLSLMRLAADNVGVSFGTMVFDEVLQGLDPALKIKAFRAFEQLAHEVGSVLLIEHDPGFQALFDNTITVQLDENGESRIDVN